jgi:hypothetical protein
VAAPQVEYDGAVLSSEEIRALGKNVLAQTETLPQTESETEKEMREPADGTVYWTEGGEVWHEWRDCSRISKKSPVLTGSIEDAVAAKKDRGCSFCCE